MAPEVSAAFLHATSSGLGVAARTSYLAPGGCGGARPDLPPLKSWSSFVEPVCVCCPGCVCWRLPEDLGLPGVEVASLADGVLIP